MASPLTATQPTDPQSRRLRLFIVAFMIAIVGFGVAFAVAGLLVRASDLYLAGVVILAYGVALAFARRIQGRGDDRRAVTITYVGMLWAALLIVPLQPELFPTLSLVPFIGAALALPYRTGRALSRLISLCCLASLAAMAIGQIQVAGAPLSPLGVALSVSSYGAAAGFVSLLLWQFSSRLLESLVEVRAANRALHEAREIERRMVEAQKLESLGVLAGGIAHDFNNLLAVILGHTALARAGLAPGAEAASSLDEIEHAASRGAVLTGQMLAYTGSSSVQRGSVDLNCAVQEAVALAGTGLAAGLVRCEAAPGLPPLDGDADQIRQLVFNLARNAVEALGARGAAVVRTSLLAEAPAPLPLSRRFLAGAPHGLLCVEVLDEGHGMDAATLARACEPFFSTRFTGRGLGLAAALGIVRGHAGALEAESAPGRGSRFRVLLPAALPAARPTPAPASAPDSPPGQGRAWPAQAAARRVLLLEDDEAIRSLVRRVLERAGYVVLEARDGEACLAMLADGTAELDCVITDLVMPGIGGDIVAQEASRLRPALPVVLMSGYDGREVASRLGGLHLAGTLQKPFAPAELLALVGAAVGRAPEPPEHTSG